MQRKDNNFGRLLELRGDFKNFSWSSLMLQRVKYPLLSLQLLGWLLWQSGLIPGPGISTWGRHSQRTFFFFYVLFYDFFFFTMDGTLIAWAGFHCSLWNQAVNIYAPNEPASLSGKSKLINLKDNLRLFGEKSKEEALFWRGDNFFYSHGNMWRREKSTMWTTECDCVE